MIHANNRVMEELQANANWGFGAQPVVAVFNTLGAVVNHDDGTTKSEWTNKERKIEASDEDDGGENHIDIAAGQYPSNWQEPAAVGYTRLRKIIKVVLDRLRLKSNVRQVEQTGERSFVMMIAHNVKNGTTVFTRIFPSVENKVKRVCLEKDNGKTY